MIPDYHIDKDIKYAIAKVEVLSFFYANPHTRDTLQGFANRLFLQDEQIASVMDELVEFDIVEKIVTSRHTIYRLKASYATISEYIK